MSPAFWKSTLPISTFKTKMANTTCRPKPQATVFLLIARRLVENAYANPNMVMRPRMPVKRPIFIPLVNPPSKDHRSLKLTFPFINHAMNQIWVICRRDSRNLVTFNEQSFRARGLCVGVALYGTERLSDGNLIADFFMHRDANRGVDGIFFAFATST